MKKFLALVLALLMALSCFSFAGAEGEGSLPTTGTEVGGNQQTENQEQQLPNGNTQTTCTSPDKKHVPGEWTVTLEPTCKSVGKKTATCTVCKTKLEDQIPMLAHTPKTEKAIDFKAATCTEDGYYEYDECSVCGLKNFRVVIRATGHNLVRVPANDKNATCTEDGYIAFKCSNPNCTYTENHTVGKLGHYWYKMNWEYTDATLKTIKYVDAVPQGTFKLDADNNKIMNVHNDEDNPEDPNSVAPTCKEPGKNGHSAVCALCGIYYNGTDPKFMEGLVIPPVEHDKYFIQKYVSGYDEEKNTCTAGTYTVEGKLVIGTAEVKKYFDAEAYGYYGPLTYEYQPQTCEKDGFVKLTCSTCGWEKTITIPKNGHQYVGLGIKYVDGDKNVQDLIVYQDEENGDFKAVEFANIAHLHYTMLTTAEEKASFLARAKDFWQNEIMKNRNWQYDCTEAPIVQYICINSIINGSCENERVDAAGWSCDEHEFGEVLAYRQQKANEQKVMEYPVAPAPEGTPDEEWEAVYEANRAAAFANISTCTDYTVVMRCWHCAQTTEKKVEGKGHKLNTLLAYLEKETCSKPGLKAVKCDLCPYNEVQTVLPHKPTTAEADYDGVTVPTTKDKDKITKNATCTEPGEMSHVCSKCGEPFTTVIPAPGHNWQHREIEKATCDKPGKEDYVCTACGEHKPGYPKVIAQRHIVDRVVSVNNIEPHVTPEGYLLYDIIDCTKDASLKYYCKNCKLVEISHKALTQHTWEEIGREELATKPYSKKNDATCLHNFKVTYGCTKCLKTKTETESVEIKHVWAEGDSEGKYNGKLVYIEPTATQRKCGQVGEAWFLCEHCGEYYKAESMPIAHKWETTWDEKNKAWTYTCELCGVEKTAVLEAPQYNVSLKDVKFGQKTTGMGQITLKNDTAATWILSNKYAYIRWTFKDGAGEDWVYEDVRPIDDNGYFDAKGIKAAPGATLHEFLVIITDDANADSKMLNQIKRYGHAAK